MKGIKPLGGKSYGSIPHLPGSRLGPGDHHVTEAQAKIATEKTRDKNDLVIVQEKLDGSNVSIAKINNQLHALTRSGYYAKDSQYLQHHYFSLWVYDNQDRIDATLREGERIVGEWIAMAHGTRHNITGDPFIAFDIMAGNTRLTYHDFQRRALYFELPRTLHVGGAFSVENAIQSIEVSGHGAIDPVEGAVWRVERNKKVDFLCKYVHHNKQDGKYFPENTGKPELWNCGISKWV